MSLRSTPSAAFLNKLWKLVNDPLTDDLIRWSPNGRSFVISDQTRFTQELVPKYFKHNNMQSFIRQLNLYGFRKLSSIESGSLVPDKGEMEFFHPNFIRGEMQLIEQIKRKSQNSRGVTTSEGNKNLKSILLELQNVKMNQEAMKGQIKELKKENDMLWRQYSHVRMKFSKQQKIIEKLVRFMLSVVDRRKEILSEKILQLPMEDEANSSSGGHRKTLKLQYEPKTLLSITGPEEPGGAVIHEVTHLDNGEDHSSALDKLFESNPSSIPLEEEEQENEEIIIPFDNNDSMDTLTNPKMEPTQAYLFDEFERDEFSNDYNVVPSSFTITSSSPEVVSSAVAATMPKLEQEYNPGFSIISDDIDANSLQLQTSDYLPSNTFFNSGVTVQSPNGTILQNSSPPPSPGVMDMVDPSVVSPNIIVAYPKSQMQIKHLQLPQQKLSSKAVLKRPAASSYSSTNIGSKVVSKEKKDKGYTGILHLETPTELFPKQRRHGKSEANTYNDKLINKISHINNLRSNFLQENYEDLAKSNNSVSHALSKGKKGINKNKGKIMSNYTVVPNQGQTPVKPVKEAKLLHYNSSADNVFNTNSDSYNLDNKQNNSDNFQVSLPSRSLSREDLEHHVDEVESTLDSFKDFLQASNLNNLNIDSSTLLSLFNNDDDAIIPIPDSEATSSGIVGNEVSLYNPFPFDDENETEGLNFASLIDDDEKYGSPTKKQKSLSEMSNKEEGFDTPQPHQMGFNFN